MTSPLLLGLPLIGAAAALAILGLVAPGPAAGLTALGVAALALMARAYRARIAEARAQIDRIIVGDGAAVGGGRQSAETRDLWSAALRLHRAGADRIDELSRLLESRASLIDAMSDAILSLDERRRIVQANSAAQRLFGGNLVGRDLASVLRHPGVQDSVGSVLQVGRPRLVDLSLTDPVERDFRVAIQPLPNRSPDGARIVLAFHDTTAMRRTERLRGDFIANASHELRTPLATLIGFIETLRGPAHDDAEARDRFLAIMHDQALRMSRLVSDLLSLSRIELNEHLPPTETLELEQLIEGVAAAFQLQAAQRRMKVILDFDHSSTPVLGDDHELQQLFQNLIDNAVKYGKVGAIITISVRRAPKVPGSFPRSLNGAIAVSVRDEGDGIGREHLPRLTERFYRISTSRSRAVGGTGLGLAIVKHIVNRHRGALTIESEPNRGSVFTIYLPAAPPDSHEQRQAC